MSSHIAQPRERVILIDTADNPDPTSGIGDDCTQPHIVLSPTCVDGEKCRGFAVAIFEPKSDDPGEGGTGSAQPSTGGFTLTFWRLNLSVGVWAKCEPYVGVGYAEQLVCYDLGGGTALYAVISNVEIPGPLHLLIAELP